MILDCYTQLNVVADYRTGFSLYFFDLITWTHPCGSLVKPADLGLSSGNAKCIEKFNQRLF